MCQFRSGEAMRVDDSEVKVLFSEREDSHTANRTAHRIGEDGGTGGLSRFYTPVEFVPTGGLYEWDKYEFRFDAGRPDWWTDSHTASAARQCLAEVKSVLLTRAGKPRKTLAWKGDLYLGSLTTVPEGFAPQAGGNLNLRSLVAAPEGFAPQAGGDLYLGSLTTVPEGFAPKAGGYLNLGSLTAVHKGFAPQAGGGLNLSSLTTVPEGFAPQAGGSLNLSSLVAAPEGFAPKAGGSLDLRSLVAAPEGFAPICREYRLADGVWRKGRVIEETSL